MCILGGDAMRILPDRIESSSLDYLFVNHPEPPQQTGGLDSQGKHLLTNVCLLFDLSIVFCFYLCLFYALGLLFGG